MLRFAVRFLAVCAAWLASAADAVNFIPDVSPRAVFHRVQGQPARIVVFSQNEIRNETVASDGVLQVLFADGTTLTLGEDSEVTIDLFSFDPQSGAARLEARLRQGVFRFIGGRTSKTPDGVALTTPFGTLTIQNAAADLSLGHDDQPPHFDLVFGQSLDLTRDGSVLARVRRPGYSIVPDASGAAVRKTPPEWKIEMQQRLSSSSGTPAPRLDAAGVSLAAAVSPKNGCAQRSNNRALFRL